eukprot:Clim_evm90s152 gene=Clim_evmTU90s152
MVCDRCKQLENEVDALLKELGKEPKFATIEKPEKPATEAQPVTEVVVPAPEPKPVKEDPPVAESVPAVAKQEEPKKEASRPMATGLQSAASVFENGEKSEKSAPAPKPSSNSAKKGWQPPKQEKCNVCEKTVYPLERIAIDDSGCYHKTCFKCNKCNKTLGVGDFAVMGSTVLCKPHYKQQFRTKGKYEIQA